MAFDRKVILYRKKKRFYFIENVFNVHFISFIILEGRSMAKRSKVKIEKDALNVVKELQSHAKDSIDDLAKKCGFSGPKLRRIIKNLEDSRTIWGYHAVTDYEKLGYNEYILLIKKSTKPIDEVAEKIISREIEQKARENDVIIACSYYLHGIYDWLFVFIAKDLRHAKKFESEFLKTYKNIVLETTLLENIFPVKRSGIQNPEIKKLKEFV